VQGSTDSGFGFLPYPFSVNRRLENRIASCFTADSMTLHSKSSQLMHPNYFSLPIIDQMHDKHMVDKILAWNFSRIRFRSIAHPKTELRHVDCRFHDSAYKVYPTHVPQSSSAFLRMIRVMTRTSFTSFWIEIIPDFVFGQSPTRKLYYVMLATVSMTLHSKSIQHMVQSSSIFLRMIRVMTRASFT
jgi:hypothetical protein